MCITTFVIVVIQTIDYLKLKLELQIVNYNLLKKQIVTCTWLIIEIIDLDISHIYSHNHMVGMDKIFSSEKAESSLKWIFSDVIFWF
jgi:hypothetical protein